MAARAVARCRCQRVSLFSAMPPLMKRHIAAGALHAPRHCRCPERTPRLVRAETGCEQLRMWKLAVCARVARGGNRFGIFSAMRRLCCAHGTSRLEISGVHGIGISRSRMLSCPPLLTERPLGLLAVYAQTALHSVGGPGSMELALCPGRQRQMALECRAPC